MLPGSLQRRAEPYPNTLRAILLSAFIFCIFGVMGRASYRAQENTGSAVAMQTIDIDYPLDKSIFPPEITAPTFQFHDPSKANRWIVSIAFKGVKDPMQIPVPGEHWKLSDLDPQTGHAELEELEAKNVTTRTWRPDDRTWAKIKSQSAQSPATITITGYVGDDSKAAISTAHVTITTSRDPVGAPIFYRDVPLMTVPHTGKGVIEPLPTSSIPLIKWELRNIAESQSHVVMEKLYTCANCHSFSRDGKTLGIDVDGPKNDKGLYALIPVQKNMVMQNQNVIRWSSFQEDLNKPTAAPSVKRFGFMSQVSPDGRYVVTSIGPPNAGNSHQNQNPDFAPGLSDRLFSTNYNHIDFTQVFYPMRGILAWYDRQTQKLRPLPGADDPNFVHTSAFWSPDGKYLIFSRAAARDPYPPGAESPTYANDPREPLIQYDLYRIPFNDGRGGKPEPVEGASQNGFSNDFPKVSPDGRWIVFVQNRNGLLMRPDSRLFIVPFKGGKARLMTCNLSLMNSWHSFSPNGRWLAFSSKARSPYTQLMLTHIDENGNDSPAILVENTTLANRAVNIPEFVNIAPDGIEKIDPQAAEIYRVITIGYDLVAKEQWTDAIAQWHKALEMDPDNADVHMLLAGTLTASHRENGAVEEYKKACELNPGRADWLAQLASSQLNTGNVEGAIASYRKSLEIEPSSPGVEAELGAALFDDGSAEEGLQHMRKATDLLQNFPRAHNYLGTALAKLGHLDEAIQEMQIATQQAPDSVEYEFNLGFIYKLQGDYADAAATFEKALALSENGDARLLSELADIYDKQGRYSEAISMGQKALSAAIQQQDEELEHNARTALDTYRQDAARATQ